ncbi:type IV pilus assembly protein PilM [Thermosyntropha lipolytica DSM 11003]|uniref:Type IV pilus assembly protein PilM n=1 Tax=Thermosyntropha lipolytica DSM 11003 TaxID=1123382 RepID=A0A1M5LMF5_9FIRM|nr:type IV pilus assembly protein PilM [Thermosyntropha lipolytica]SHG66146.1 type IV pilus assembly protein PilM [Thermosyntropha lipolytica DSM 11003]
MFKDRITLGLDIGTERTKIALLQKRGREAEIKLLESLPTPRGFVDSGNILEPVQLGEEIKKVVEKHGLKGRKTAASVSGPQVYTRIFTMPEMKKEELREAALYQASTFLPIPLEEAAVDVYPLRLLEDDEGKKREVFFVAVRKSQVERLQIVCETAGLNLQVVDIEPLALERAAKAPEEIKAFLHIGSNRAQFSVFAREMLVIHRSLSFGCSAFLIAGNPSCPVPETLENIDVRTGEYDYLVSDMMGELLRAVEYYRLQNKEPLMRIYISGGGSRLKGLDEVIEKNTGVKASLVELNQVFRGKELDDEKRKREIKYDFMIALGLALRGVI